MSFTFLQEAGSDYKEQHYRFTICFILNVFVPKTNVFESFSFTSLKMTNHRLTFRFGFMINLNLIFEKQPLLILSSQGSLLHRLTIGTGLSLDAELETRHSNNQRIILGPLLAAMMLKLAKIKDLAYQTKVPKCCPNRNYLLIVVKMVTSFSSSQA